LAVSGSGAVILDIQNSHLGSRVNTHKHESTPARYKMKCYTTNILNWTMLSGNKCTWNGDSFDSAVATKTLTDIEDLADTKEYSSELKAMNEVGYSTETFASEQAKPKPKPKRAHVQMGYTE